MIHDIEEIIIDHCTQVSHDGVSVDTNGAAAAILAAGYRKLRTITTPEEAGELADGSAFITPGHIIFHKWEDYYGEGKHAWERELGQAVPDDSLDPVAHFPATVLWEPQP